MHRAGIPQAGRRKKPADKKAGEQCLAMMAAQGLSLEEVAKARGIKLKSVERSVRRAKSE
jgi:hypothetical protein